MNYAEFAEAIRKELADFYQDEARVELHRVNKNNREAEMGICILPKGESISPLIYLHPHYLRYTDGRSLVDVLSDIIRQYNEAEKMHFPVDQLKDWKQVKERLGARLVCAVNNDAYLDGIPHRRFLDLALIYYILFEGPEGRKSSAVVSHSQMELWGITEEDLYRQSSENLPGMMKPLVMRLDDMLTEMILDDPSLGCGLEDETVRNLLRSGDEEDVRKEERGTGSFLHVVTNNYRYMGAVTVFYPGLLDTILHRLGWDNCYIIPSSIHEVLLFPCDLESDERRLVEMVKEVNDSSVEASERLSYSVYYYDTDHRILEMVPVRYPVKDRVIMGLRTGRFREL